MTPSGRARTRVAGRGTSVTAAYGVARGVGAVRRAVVAAGGRAVVAVYVRRVRPLHPLPGCECEFKAAG
jgi:hypothetical protein